MGQQNAEIVRKGFEAFNAGEMDRLLEFFDPDIEYQTSREDPDAATHLGHEAYRRYVEQWQESFEGLAGELEECVAVGDDRVFTWLRWTGRGSASGVNAEWRLAIIYTLHNGRIVRGEEYFDRGEALDVVGLAE